MTYFLNIAKIHVNYAYKRMRKLQRKIGFAITNDFHYIIMFHFSKDFPGGSEVKVSDWNAGDQGLIPGSGRSPGEGNGNPLQYSYLQNPMEGGAW